MFHNPHDTDRERGRRHHREDRPEGHHERHRGPGFGPGFGQGFGPGFGGGPGDRFFFRRAFGPGGPAGGFGHGGMRRGEIRPLILAALATKPMHGYEVIQGLESNSGGRWRPSAGSVYPTLQQLADEGLLTSEEIDGRRVYTITDAGRTAAAATPTPRSWTDGPGDGTGNLPEAVKGLLGAAMQVQRMGTPQAREETLRILTGARKQIYRLLADDEAPTASGEAATDQG